MSRSGSANQTTRPVRRVALEHLPGAVSRSAVERQDEVDPEIEVPVEEILHDVDLVVAAP